MTISGFVSCEECGKRLIERKSDGMWVFAFGKTAKADEPAVEMFIYGAIKIRCFRKSCGHWNILNHF
jgi:hypothetical protein